jgi:uncharacterized spore protein YtfJ
MEQFEKMIEQVAEKVGELARSDLVAGAPIEVGGVTIVPLSRIGVGFGGGGGEGEGDMRSMHDKKHGGPPFEQGKGAGLGAGAGGKVRPVAVVVFGPDGVRVEQIPERKGTLDKIFDRIPELIDLAQRSADKKCG